mmetsp:Transcript_41418/g.66605  ORF Transcript_41418/g.66605 Transcript_41418/m.66605 type:complete len:200 (+) Transcript_41418:636-1235(+)
MKPCCLEILDGEISRNKCEANQRLGGATGWNERSCPSSADEAAKLLKRRKSSDVSVIIETEKVPSKTIFAIEKTRNGDHEGEGCCFTIGFGAQMEPCCLEVLNEKVSRSKCEESKRLGAATGWSASTCPASALEGAQIVKQQRKTAIRVGTDDRTYSKEGSSGKGSTWVMSSTSPMPLSSSSSSSLSSSSIPTNTIWDR